MSKKKRIMTVALCMLLVFGLSATAFAASFDFYFDGEFVGSLNRTGARTCTSSPYVNPDGYINATTFMLLEPDTLNIASDVLDDVTSPGKKEFEYEPGYGGGTQQYEMGGHPTNYDYEAYYASGTWSP